MQKQPCKLSLYGKLFLFYFEMIMQKKNEV